MASTFAQPPLHLTAVLVVLKGGTQTGSNKSSRNSNHDCPTVTEKGDDAGVVHNPTENKVVCNPR